jgi:SAM-dependent methyltransferase
MFVPKFDKIDTHEASKLTAFLDLAHQQPDVVRWKNVSHELLQVGEGDVVLDVGCGAGVDAVALARLVGVTGRVVGADLSHALLAVAQERAVPLGLPVAFQHADINELPFADASFTRSRIDRVLHFLPDPAHALREVARVTAAGGRIVVTEPDWRTLVINGGEEALTSRIIEAGVILTPSASVGAMLPELLAEAGLTVADCRTSQLHLRTYPVAALLFSLEVIANRATASSRVDAKEAVQWIRSLQHAAVEGSFDCALGGSIACGIKR